MSRRISANSILGTATSAISNVSDGGGLGSDLYRPFAQRAEQVLHVRKWPIAKLPPMRVTDQL
jgi:hypothetical protein